MARRTPSAATPSRGEATFDVAATAVAGMHRSGTSLVARLLHDCGLDLGEAADLLPANADNTEGYWENVHFVQLSDRILDLLGGGWDFPPAFSENWAESAELEPIREAAAELVLRFDPNGRWGWKDPRTSLTLPFWLRLLPNLQAVVCVRHPVEVARSLTSRASASEPFGLQLWETYYEALLGALEGREYVVTHYDAYFVDAEAELRRLLDFLDLPSGNDAVVRAATRVNEFARHQQAGAGPTEDQLPPGLSALYERLCAAAGPVFEAAATTRTRTIDEKADQNADQVAEAPTRELPPPEPSGFKYHVFDDSPESTHRLVVSLVPARARVLEVGCASGYMSRVLREEKRCSVVGIEVSPEAAEEARPHLDRLIVGDAETLDLDNALGGETFDVVLFADVLEHLRDPAGLLRRVRPFLGDAGVVVASIPNVAHASVRLALLAGEFRYRPVGLLDDTHLRFFTRATIDDLFETSGYVVEDWHRRRIDPDQTELGASEATPEIREQIASDPEATTYQFVVRAVASDASRRLAATRGLLREARSELSELRPLRQELDEQRAQLRADLPALRLAHEALSRRLLAERSAMADRLDEVATELEQEREVIASMREEIEWRTGVMEALEEARGHLEEALGQHEHQLATLQHSRSMRYTAPLRSFAWIFRRRP